MVRLVRSLTHLDTAWMPLGNLCSSHVRRDLGISRAGGTGRQSAVGLRMGREGNDKAPPPENQKPFVHARWCSARGV